MRQLLDALDPALKRMAHQIVGHSSADDAVQAAQIKIWRKLKFCDVDRPASIRGWLLKVAVRAMRDEGRRLRRRSAERLPFDVKDETEVVARREVFTGLLAHYVQDLEEHADFNGIHARVGAKLGIRRVRMTWLFHQAVKQFLKELPKDEADSYRRKSGRVRLADILANGRGGPSATERS